MDKVRLVLKSSPAELEKSAIIWIKAATCCEQQPVLLKWQYTIASYACKLKHDRLRIARTLVRRAYIFWGRS